MNEMLELFFDESGQFDETGTVKERRFPSQLAGIWAKAGRITRKKGAALMQAAPLPVAKGVNGSILN